MRLSPSNRESLRMAARLHDVGKLFVPTDIISKVTALNEIEYGFIKEHPGKSYELLKGIPFDGPVLDTILQHHERLDGSGYPCNLAGDDIIITARILAVADVVEAMLSNRPHRRAHSLNETLSEIKTNSGKLYDSQVVEACLSLFDGGFAFESDKE
jgi:HD-GYP domain-containing protein (c-di-GMP phosphodiesterase class II)